MPISPLASAPLFRLGPVGITTPVVTTWGIMAAMAVAAWLGTRRLAVRAGPVQAVLEILVETIAAQLRDVMRRDPGPWLPLIGTLFLYLAAANLCGVLPAVAPPTSRLETPAALAVVVFCAVHVAGVRSRGVGGYLKSYLQPNPLLLPLNILEEITRTFSLAIRLFGNMMSHELVVAIVLLLAGLLVPVPFLLLAVMIGLIQAYIFTVLAAVFIAAAADTSERG
jgi:F-type H+-transporting ATPase subunit a